MAETRKEYQFDNLGFMADIRDAAGNKPLRDLADRVGVSASTLSRIDNGMTPDMQTFTLICAKLELNPADYFKLVIWVKSE